ncbi:MAG: site-specific integrase [Actinomycetota bacterium]|nr:site-specific integrase [Actinomycetota bacterium]
MNKQGRGDGTIYFEESRQRWVAAFDVRSNNGKRQRRRVTGPTRAKAREAMRIAQSAQTDGLPVPDGSLTVKRFLEDWLANTVPAVCHSSNTVANYKWAVDKHLVPALGGHRLRDLSPDDVDHMLRARAATGLSRSSLMRLRMVLGRALRHAERRGKVVRNVATLADLPKAGKGRESRALSVEQAKALLDAAKGDRLEALFVTGLMCALRPGELLGLTWDDVDLDAATLQVRRSLKRDGTALYIGELKTPRSRRALNLPAQVVEALKAHRARQAAERLVAGDIWQDFQLVFATDVGTPTDPSNLRRSFSRLTCSVGIGHWRPYELRHSAASILSAARVPLEEVADIMGHDGTRMTALVYRHAMAPTVDAGVKPMEALFGSPG